MTSLKRLSSLLANLEIFPVIALAAASFLFERLLPWAVGLAFVFWLVRWAGSGRPSLRTPADLGVGLVALMVPVTLWATALPELTQPQVYRLLLGIGLYYTVANWAISEGRLRLVVLGTAAAGLALCLLAPVGVEWASNKLQFVPNLLARQFPLLLSDTIHPNVLGGTLALFIPLAAAPLLFGLPRLRWWAQALLAGTLGLSFLLMTAVLILTKSRGGWIAVAAVLVLLPLLRWRWGWLGLLLAGLAAAGGLYSLGPQPVLELLSSNNTLGGVEGRVEIWSRAIYMVQDFPFTGVGMGSFMQVADLLYPFFLAAPGKIEHAHNLLLQVAVDLGLPGLLGWLVAYLTISFTAWQVYRHGRRAPDAWAAGLGAGLLLSQAALMLHGLVDAVTWGMVRPAPFVWILWGLAAAAGRVYLHRRSSLTV